MNLNEKNAKNFAIKVLSKKFKDSDLKWIIEHCKNVKRCCQILKRKDIDQESLKISAWLHDLGRIVSEETHSEESLKITKKEFSNINSIIEDCILNHSFSKVPKTKEGKIFQLADKMSLLSPELFISYAKEDKEKAVDFFKEGLDKLFNLSRKFDFK